MLLSLLLLGLLPALISATPGERRTPAGAIGGMVRDATGAPVPGALVSLRVGGIATGETYTDGEGFFVFDPVGAGPVTVTVSLEGFRPVTVDVVAGRPELLIQLTLRPISEEITVRAEAPETLPTTTATKTETPLRDVPQAITIVSRRQVAEQGMQGLADLVRLVPGVTMAQGEGNRDAAVFRGHSSTADFFQDGIRDDVQYFRDLYNVERVEVLKGPNGMIFGRGGAGGVLNRVSRQAGWDEAREATLQLGSFDNRRATIDVGEALGPRWATRMTGMYERSDSYRQGVGLERYALNPTMAIVLGDKTTLRAGYEYFHDERTPDRGEPSYGGRPLPTDPSLFFGSAGLSESRAKVHALTAALDHRVGGAAIRTRTRYADYAKFYQNVFPGAVNGAGTGVSIAAYNNTTSRQNLFHQTDVVFGVATGSIRHTLAIGGELGRQATDNLRHTGYFGGPAASATSIAVPLESPAVTTPVSFRASATDADNHGVAHVAAVYVQDEIQVTQALRAVAGVRYESFSITLDNNRNQTSLQANDRLVSPRVGLVYRVAAPVSVYGSYSVAHLPRAGEQLASLSVSTRSLDPEAFRNYEVGAKWDLRRDLAVTAALYHLDRRNVAVADAADPTRLVLVNGQRARGFEAGVSGRLARGWTVAAAYAFQDGVITRSQSASALAGARLAQLPAHTVSIWNRYDPWERWGVGVGVTHRGAIFASTDNAVTIPGFTRLDAAVFATLSARLSAQVNVENVLDARYFASAHSNNNIMPGSPRAVRLSLCTRF
ncbi:MAG TPA: TonB-dependent siderophore receptor [Vicinamibacterales bacterium]|nr:TonB-dependent siderophore receptor [Vicinamibacterales bacterium]